MTMQHRLTRTLVAAAAATLLIAAAATAAPANAAPAESYVPFVTDFPSPGARKQAAEFVPFVTDFPKAAVVSASMAEAAERGASPAATAGRIEWDVAGVRAGIGAALAVLAASGIVLIRRVRPARA